MPLEVLIHDQLRISSGAEKQQIKNFDGFKDNSLSLAICVVWCDISQEIVGRYVLSMIGRMTTKSITA